MLNDYEITRIDNDKIHPIVAILKFISSALAVYCFMLMVPDFVDQYYETRESVVEDSLNIRVIANSNTHADQQLKEEMVDNLQPFFTEIQQNSMLGVDNDETFANLYAYVHNHYSQYDVKINVGKHLTPPKMAEYTFYPQDYYNSLVLTIGAGRGDNFWCSIFSNLCERPSEKAEEEEEQVEEDEKVTFIIWEWLKSLFS